jgi:hypothetical protein
VTLAVPADLDIGLVANARAAADIHGLELDVVPVAELDALRSRRAIHNYGHVSDFTYSKLVLAEILPHLDDVLYLDVDTFIRAPLDELLAWELHHSIGAVIQLEAGTHLFGTSRQPYFNAGVLRMSLERMRREQVWARSRMILEEHAMTVVDQDVFNLLFMDRFDSLPLTYNVTDTTVRNHRLTAIEDPVIVHFAGEAKPWHPSNSSPFAREWRRYLPAVSASMTYPSARVGDADPEAEVAVRKLRGSNGRSPEAGRSRLRSVAKAVLPEKARITAKAVAIDVFDRTLSRVEKMQAALFPDQEHVSSWGLRPVCASDSADGRLTSYEMDETQGLDLLISMPRSGTNALGAVIEKARPEVRWLHELYLGEPWGLRSGELSDKFPWFAAGHPEIRKRLPTEQRGAAEREFAEIMSRHAIDVTKAVVESGHGRTLIKIFPCQLHPTAFTELLEVFRPRLLILRRDLVFSYISMLRAARVGSWWESDLTDVPFTVSDRHAMHHALQADSWYDGVARAATDLALDSTWVTYQGLFTTGKDIPLLESFYPGPPMPVGPSGGLLSDTAVQDRRTDSSVLAMVKALSSLSATTQHKLFRLPGSQP